MDRFLLKEEYFTDCAVTYHKVKEDGSNIYGTLSHVDHPSFAALREHLGQKGFIDIQHGWLNGDRVIKEFMLNETLFEVGDKFCTASAQGCGLRFARTKIKEVIDFFPDV